jgi:hypothetical protein
VEACNASACALPSGVSGVASFHRRESQQVVMRPPRREGVRHRLRLAGQRTEGGAVSAGHQQIPQHRPSRLVAVQPGVQLSRQ